MKGDDRGQATVEFALLLPLVALSAWLPIAAGALASAQIDVASAARNAAREAAMSPNPVAAADDVARASTALRPLRVETTATGGLVQVTVVAEYGLALPVPGLPTPSITLASRAAVSSEMHPAATTDEVEESSDESMRRAGRPS